MGKNKCISEIEIWRQKLTSKQKQNKTDENNNCESFFNSLSDMGTL